MLSVSRKCSLAAGSALIKKLSTPINSDVEVSPKNMYTWNWNIKQQTV